MSIANDPIWKQIDTVKYLYLQRLFEPRDTALTIALEEAAVNKANTAGLEAALANLPEPLRQGESSLIEHTSECSVFTMQWHSYVAYNVTEEMHGSCGKYDQERYSGRLLRIYSASNYLAFIAADTGAHSKPYTHYKICCLNHIIDIVSAVEPTLSAVRHSESKN